MDIRQLRLFDAVARGGSLARGAAEMGMTVPGAKAAIDALERECGLVLLERTNRGVSLTAQGRVFLPRARNALAEVEAGLAEAASSEPRRKRVRLFEVAGAQYHIPYDCFAGAIARLREEDPSLEVTVERAAAMPAPARNGIYLGAIDPAQTTLLAEHRVHAVQMYALFAPGHALEGDGSLSLAELERWPLLVCDRFNLPHVEPALGPWLASRAAGYRYQAASEEDGVVLSACLAEGMVALMAGVPPSVAGTLAARPLAGHVFWVCDYTLPDAEPHVLWFVDYMRRAFFDRYGDRPVP